MHWPDGALVVGRRRCLGSIGWAEERTIWLTLYVIGRSFEKATAFALAGTFLTFFGFIHGAEGIGINGSPTVAVSYLGVAAILFCLAQYAEFHPVALEAAAEADRSLDPAGGIQRLRADQKPGAS
jgi:hypothetical protein